MGASDGPAPDYPRRPLASGRVGSQLQVLLPQNPPTLGGVGAPPTSPVGSARGADPGPEKPWRLIFGRPYGVFLIFL